MVETPAYDLTIFKVHYGKMTLKIYSKGERVLRSKSSCTAPENTVGAFPEIVVRLKGILERFLGRPRLYQRLFRQR